MNQRPLSPHLQVYRLPVTGLISISHRLTGVVMSIGVMLLVLLPVTIAMGPVGFAALHEFLASVAGRALVWLWILSLLLHLCHGLRHLLWDVGVGYSREHLMRNAVLELLACVLLAALVGLSQFNSP